MRRKKKNNFLLFIILFLVAFFGTLFYFNNHDFNLLVNDNNFVDNNTTTNTTNNININDLNLITSYFCPEDNCENVFINLINNTQKSISCSVYEINNENVSHALINKHNQDIDIRLVTDIGTSSHMNSKIGLLKSEGITVIESPNENRYMHQKFCVFDDEVVWVGSTNLTDNCLLKNNNDFLIIKDKTIATIFNERIDAFFENKFYDNEQNLNRTNYSDLNVFFCPEDKCLERLLPLFRNVNDSIYCMLFSFTLNDLIYELKENDLEEIDAKFILETRLNSQYSVYHQLIDINQPVILDKNSNTMHHKFCVIDKETIVTGSLNFSNNGVTKNNEVIVILNNKEIANNYYNHFQKYWQLWSNE